LSLNPLQMIEIRSKGQREAGQRKGRGYIHKTLFSVIAVGGLEEQNPDGWLARKEISPYVFMSGYPKGSWIGDVKETRKRTKYD